MKRDMSHPISCPLWTGGNARRSLFDVSTADCKRLLLAACVLAEEFRFPQRPGESAPVVVSRGATAEPQALFKNLESVLIIPNSILDHWRPLLVT